MKGNYFIDTNIFVYSFDFDELEKRKKAKEIIKNALVDGRAYISFQVIQEFFNVATKKFKLPLNIHTAKEYLEKVFMQLNIVYPCYDFMSAGLDISTTTKYSFYDSLIISAALKSSCAVLLTEDLQHGQKIQNLRIENPFLHS